MKSKHQKRIEAKARLEVSILHQEETVKRIDKSRLNPIPAWDPEQTPWVKSYAEWSTMVYAAREAQLKTAIAHLRRMREEALNISKKIGAFA